jgi:hypothetical protein
MVWYWIVQHVKGVGELEASRGDCEEVGMGSDRAPTRTWVVLRLGGRSKAWACTKGVCKTWALGQRKATSGKQG